MRVDALSRTRNYIRRFLIFVAVPSLLLATTVGAQETNQDDILATDDFDSLFAQDEMIEESDDTVVDSNPETELLVSKGIEWGGSIRGSLMADWSWGTAWTSEFGLFDPTFQTLSPRIGADLFFDSRPDPAFRVFGKFKIDTTNSGGIDVTGLSLSGSTVSETFLPAGWTAEENAAGDVEIRDGSGTLILTIPSGGGAANEQGEGATGVAPGLDISVFELFSDYAYKETLFFRFGKHTIRWGTGYFFSPADVLNLTSIDPEDPTLDRAGPLSLRTHYPFGITGNAYLYLIANDDIEPLDLALAPKVEFAIGAGELGIGAYYQRALAPRLVALASYSLGDVDLFGEGVLLYGSDRVFVRPSRDQSAAATNPNDGLDMVLDTYTIDDAIFAQATVGARYLKKWDNVLSLLIAGQYFFNGDGYADEVDGIIPAAARLLLFAGENGLALGGGEQPDDYEAPPALSLTDLSNWGRHYAGATVAATNLFDTDLGVSLFSLVNLSDFSGIISPAISYSFLDRFSVSLAARFTFGDANDELTDPASVLTGDEPAPTFGITLSVSMPGGRF